MSVFPYVQMVSLNFSLVRVSTRVPLRVKHPCTVSLLHFLAHTKDLSEQTVCLKQLTVTLCSTSPSGNS